MKHAVLTGDLVGSSRAKNEEQIVLKNSLKHSFQGIKSLYQNTQSLPSFDVFRGDSFQGVIENPLFALEAGLFIRATLRKSQTGDQKSDWDARIAIGIGEIDYLPDRVSEGDGPAYRSSGPVLDDFDRETRLAVQTPWKHVNEELNTGCALLDVIIAKWTPPQAEVVTMLLEGKERKEIGEILGISQAAIHYRIKGSGWHAVEKFIKRYHTVVNQERS